MKKINVLSIEEGIEKAKEILYEKVKSETLLFLSGGSSPKPLYEKLAQDEVLNPGAVAMVDERYGEPFHKKSNEKMIKETGLFDYFQTRQIPWYPILQQGLSREEAQLEYETIIKELFDKFAKRVAIVSIGADGHTAGIPTKLPSPLLRSPLRGRGIVQTKIYGTPPRRGGRSTGEGFTAEYNDTTGSFGERITITFQALEKMDFFLLWVFGNEKKEALKNMLTSGSEAEIPARFYLRKEIEGKVIMITDQKI